MGNAVEKFKRLVRSRHIKSPRGDALHNEDQYNKKPENIILDKLSQLLVVLTAVMCGSGMHYLIAMGRGGHFKPQFAMIISIPVTFIFIVAGVCGINHAPAHKRLKHTFLTFPPPK